MTIAFEASERPDHVVLECTGSFTYQSLVHLYEQAFARAVAAGRGAVLIDVRRIAGPPPTVLERVNGALVVVRLQESQRPKVRLAVLGKEPIIHPERLGEIVAAARGAVARVFTDEAEALDWLIPKQKSP